MEEGGQKVQTFSNDIINTRDVLYNMTTVNTVVGHIGKLRE